MDKVVYRHLKPNGEVFYIGVGKTKKRAYSKYDRNKHWYNTVNKYGYTVEIIAEVDTWELACELEQFLIQEYGRRDLGLGSLVNMTDGGEGGLGRKVSDETKTKISKANKGFKHSEEVRQKLRDANLGKKMAEETKLKISEAHTGKKLSEEAKAKLSEANKGKTYSEETKAKMSKAQRGEKSHRAKKVICTETGNIWHTISSCAIDNGLNIGTLERYLNGRSRNKTTFKYYKNDEN